jgi:polyisoprenoid-binding protein YceI
VKHLYHFFRAGLLSFATSTALFAGSYSVDPVHSHVGFKVKHLMISYVKGDFKTFSGSFVYDEATNQLTTLHGTIEVASVDTGIDKRDAHLKSDEFFDQKRYPTISFELKKIEADRAYGLLTIRGVTQEVALDIEYSSPIKDPWGQMRVGVSLEGKISRKAFGLTYNKLLETGGVAVGDSVKLDVALEGILDK